MPANRTMPDCTVIPELVYDDVGEAATWLCEMFGFTERWRAGNHRCQLAVGGGGAVVLTEARRAQGWADEAGPADFCQPRLGEITHSVMVRVEDVDRHHEHAESRGAKILRAPADYPYGERQYTAEDPSGRRWSFSQSIADVSPEEWGGVAADGDGEPARPADGERGQTSILPQLSVRDGRAAIEFYKRAFGALEDYRVGGTDEHQAVVAQLSVRNASFWVADEAPAHANFSPESVGGARTRMLLIVDDPESVLERAVTAGARRVRPVAEEHRWLLGRVEDPFGHHWEIGKPLVDWPPATGAPGHV